jgi:predicted ABC-type ATPase
MNTQPRLRMFAGPNGSGKSTLKAVIHPSLLGVYINPDDIEKEIRQFGFLDLSVYDITSTAEEILAFFHASTLLRKAELVDNVLALSFNDNKLSFFEVEVNAYFASVASDFIRQKLLQAKTSFSFETVMSFEDKVELLKKAQEHGFRTYLYYIATEDPIINISRVSYRLSKGGHDVPVDKIESRYHRSLALLHEALLYTNRAYFFDNSGLAHTWLAEMDEEKRCVLKTNVIPQWFKRAVLSYLDNDLKLDSTESVNDA